LLALAACFLKKIKKFYKIGKKFFHKSVDHSKINPCESVAIVSVKTFECEKKFYKSAITHFLASPLISTRGKYAELMFVEALI